jgi:hypothetical protein
MLLMYERSSSARCANSSCEMPCDLRTDEIACPSATSAGSSACFGDGVGMDKSSCTAYDHTTDDNPQKLLQCFESTTNSELAVLLFFNLQEVSFRVFAPSSNALTCLFGTFVYSRLLPIQMSPLDGPAC